MPNNNPTGKGGLGENPHNINKKGRPHEPSITRIVKEKLQEFVGDKNKRLDEIIGEGIVKRALEILAKSVSNWSAAEQKLIFEIWHILDGMPVQKNITANVDDKELSEEDKQEIWNSLIKRFE
jgi:hypothetical protein